MNIIQRVQAPTPTFFKKLRNIGLALATVALALFKSPVTLPAAVIKAAGYIAVAGTVVGAVSQTASEGDDGSGG